MSQSGSSQVRIEVPAAQSPGGRGGSSVSTPKSIVPDDRTVISDRPPLAPQPGMERPFELGKLLAGDRLGHFELLEYVGGGGMGAVFRARDTMLDREVALKVLSRSQGADEETRRRFHVEAQSAARLDHQNIARVYYVGEDQGLNFIVFEFIRGVNVRDLVERQGTLSLDDAISFTLQIAEALAHASKRSVVHRDIKPSNIIVTEEGRAKLVDMGLARLHARSDDDDLTASGVTLGTFDYISPEQARDPRLADVRSDIYSLGCTLYFMLTARPPFPDGTVLQKLLQHQADEAPDPRQFNPNLPDEIVQLLRHMLAKDPRRRFQESAELIHELLVLNDRLGLRPLSTGQFWVAAKPRPAPFWERHLPWIAPLVALVLIAAGLEWWGASSNAPSLHEMPADVPQRTSPEMPVRTADVQAPAENAPATAATEQLRAPKVSPEPSTSGVDTSGQGVAPTSDLVSVSRDSRPDATRDSPGGTTPGTVSEVTPGAFLAGPDITIDAPAAPRTREALPAADDTDSPTNNVVFDHTDRADVQATESSASALPLLNRSGIAILSAENGERRQFNSLKSACSVAKNNDVIELQFNDARVEEPLEINNQRITIRAADGFRPVVAFRPARHGLAGFGRSMVAIAGGRVTMLNVSFDLEVPQDATAESWALFETRQTEQLSLDGCTLTIRNANQRGDAFHELVSFFEVKAAPGVDTMMKTPESPPIHPLELEIRNCIVRGEATLARSPDAQPLNLDWQNGLLAISDWLFVADGSTAMPPTGWRTQINLNHLTAVAGRGLIRLSATSDSPYVLKTEVSCGNSVLVTQDVPLVEQSGPQRISTLEQQFQWSGDRNLCLGATPMWQVVDTNMPTVPRAVLLPQWQAHWGRGDTLLAAQTPLWKRSRADDRRLHTLRRDDFVLNDRARAGGQFEASDGGEVGMEWRKLPEVATTDSFVPTRSR